MFGLPSDKLMRWAGIEAESVVDGPGLRAVVFFQGCPHHCPGCHNPETWDPSLGHESTVGAVWEAIAEHPLLQGITLSGGEPFMQVEAAAYLASKAKAKGWNVMVYTGYTWEALMDHPDEDRQALLEHTDILVDGPFIQGERDHRLVFRGSRNQRIIRVPESLTAKSIVLWEGNRHGLGDKG